MNVSRAEMLARCRRAAPDFRLERLSVNGRAMVRATCTLAGRPVELAVEAAGIGAEAAEIMVLEGCVASMGPQSPKRRRR
jgi:hypothetical protein